MEVITKIFIYICKQGLTKESKTANSKRLFDINPYIGIDPLDGPSIPYWESL